ncbi:D-aminoacyl-tRNA deacylase [Marinobacter bryozoorum]|jgi:D-tyrosyl-tRNA(Tyr) deacylase|uniref:D-aminoacyl-tRNA deacylase n=1 Tax=Marinobacter bryozoorum TaxID=256324 RepID=UPI00200469FC|nr:D-aminoacyl-tRNA deacylase [Marinobacter bryozoorum]MCK7544797.1 D-aminoacyl-tRNA deacylase [Marinobacter bryozoorum]
MKGLIQRVTEASVSVDGKLIASIDDGLLLLLGVERNDGVQEVDALLGKIARYRVFPDEKGRMNRSLEDCGGSLLIVPQFTLAADTRSGTRPGFSDAAEPGRARELVAEFVRKAVGRLGQDRVGQGEFGADMKVALVNDGPVTFLLSV